VLLARRLVERISAEMGRPGITLSGETERALAAHLWPGNVRQLRNVLERAVLLSDHPVLCVDDVGDALAGGPAAAVTSNQRLSLAEAERQHIESVLRAERGAVPRAAEVLGLSRSALYEKLKKHGLSVRKPSTD
jgi:DNA-binding NtrC family response regulator